MWVLHCRSHSEPQGSVRLAFYTARTPAQRCWVGISGVVRPGKGLGQSRRCWVATLWSWQAPQAWPQAGAPTPLSILTSKSGLDVGSAGQGSMQMRKGPTERDLFPRADWQRPAFSSPDKPTKCCPLGFLQKVPSERENLWWAWTVRN